MGTSALIQNLDINLRGNTSNFDAGLDRGIQSVGKFKGAVEQQGMKTAQVASGIGSAFSVGMTVVAGAALAGVAAVTAFTASLVALANSQAPVIADMHKIAQTLGFTTEGFSTLQSASGIDLEPFQAGMFHMERTLSKAALTGGKTAQSL